MISNLVLMAVIVFMAMFLGRFFPWERLLRRKLSQLELVFSVIFSIALPFTLLGIQFPTWTSMDLLITFWSLCGSAVIGSMISQLIYSLIDARSRAEETLEREERLLEEIKK